VIEPGKTIGILGGGQLGRMFAIAARRMGYRIHCLDPVQYGPTGQIADVEVNAPYDDIDSAVEFAQSVDVVTFEFENVPAPTLQAIEKIVPVHPSPAVLETTRHRLREKTFLTSSNFPVTPWRAIHSMADLQNAISELRLPCVLKTAEFGYDGKGQSKITSADQIESAWAALGGAVGVLEAFVPFDFEVSVVGARGVDGKFVAFPTFVNEHRNHILDVTYCDYDAILVSRSVNEDAIDIATQLAQTLEVVGTMCVEMFVKQGQVIVNEIAPRPHNSGHLTIDACNTCQFEQQVRAVCGLTLGNPRMHTPAAAMANILGDAWQSGQPNFASALAISGDMKLHLYGKSDPRSGRKMGHLTGMASTAADAKRMVVDARHQLSVCKV